MAANMHPAASLNFAHLRSFVAVAEFRSFTEAASRLGLTQPCISFHIKQLEEDLGIKLFIRDRRQIELTKAASVVLSHTEAIFNLAGHLRAQVRDLAQDRTGTISIGAGVFFAEHYLPDLLTRFKKRYPNVNIRCDAKPTRALFPKLQNFEYDFAFLGDVPVDENLEVVQIAQDDIVVIVAPDHPLSRRSTIALHELSDWPLIGYMEDSETQSKIDVLFAKEKVTPSSFLVYASSEGMKRAVEAGIGIALFPRKPALRELKERSLKALTIKGHALRRRYTFVYRRDNPLSPAAKAFRDEVLSWKGRTATG